MHTLHIFNPDTDYALGANDPNYTPPARVAAVRARLALVPALYASEGDAILVPHDFTRDENLLNIAKLKSLLLIKDNDLRNFADSLTGWNVDPWGWNPAIRRFLVDNAPWLSGIWDSDRINALRNLSHRRTTIDALSLLHKMGCALDIDLPIECRDLETLSTLLDTNPNRFIKMPWSSSGRGVLVTAGLSRDRIEPWVRGAIRQQGSVIVERAYNRSLDFATEWNIANGSANFVGVSVFETSPRGKYLGNVNASQDALFDIIASHCNNVNDVIDAQRSVLEQLIAPHYAGPAGIDMLVTNEGSVNPCIEINLRHTMGSIRITNNKQ